MTWFCSDGMTSLSARIQSAQRESQGDSWVRPEEPVLMYRRTRAKSDGWSEGRDTVLLARSRKGLLKALRKKAEY